MSLKKKLFTTITMFALVFSMVLVGVWAISADTISFGGTITFTATNILATISGEVSGTASDPTLQDLIYNSAGGPSTTALNSWSNNLTFKEDGSAFTIKITIQNDSSRKIYWSIKDTVASNANISKTISTYNLGATNELAGNGKAEFTITIGLANGTNNSVSGSYGYQIDLKDESEHVVDPNAPIDITNGHDYLTFGTPSGNTISVTDCNTSVTSVEIPAKVVKSGVTYDVTSVGASAFADCGSMTEIEIPASVENIGNDAFKNCSALKEVNYLGDVNSWAEIILGTMYSNPIHYSKSLKINGEEVTSVVIDSATTINANVFASCQNITSVTIENTVTEIGSSAFDNCIHLKSVTIGSQVSWIGAAFTACPSLETIVVDDNNQTYRDEDSNCVIDTTELDDNSTVNRIVVGCKSTVIPDTVQVIGPYSFTGCGLTSITIPASVTYIAMDAFFASASLTTVVMESETPPTLDDGILGAFGGCPLTAIYVPSEAAVSAYSSEMGWMNYSSYITTR